MAELTDLASLKRAFYRLLDTESDDPGLTEHDNTSEETAEQLLTYGAHDAQDFLLEAGRGDLWIKETTVGGNWSGSDTSDGGRYQALPSDFLRLAGDERVSALREPDGDMWGRLVDWDTMRKRLSGNYYWIESDPSDPNSGRLWIARAANPPNDLEMAYHYRIDLTGDPVAFPSADRPLIVAYAGHRAVHEPWAPGGSELFQKVTRNLEFQKSQSRRRNRTSRQPRQMRQLRGAGTHWMFG